MTSGGEGCTFCQIAAGTRSAAIVFEDASCVAFLDHRPLFPGHVLLAPREHIPTLAHLPDSILPELFSNARLLARAVERATTAQGTFVAMNNRVSQSVPHLHIHIVPRRKGDGLRGFFWPRNPYPGREEMLIVQEAIRRAVEAERSG